MKKIIYFVLFFTWIGFVKSQDHYSDSFEIVESIPVETGLDNPDIRNTYEVWSEMINGAKQSLDIEQFYISGKQGQLFGKILDAIVSAGRRGVNVRIIVDSRMYKTYPEYVDKLGTQMNIKARVINFGRLAGGIQHAKYFIVDGEEIFLGSQNFDWRVLEHIHEIGVRIKNSDVVLIYQDIFNLDWNLAGTDSQYAVSDFLKPNKYRLPLKIFQGNDTIMLYPTMSPKSLISDSALWDESNIVELIDEAKNDFICQFLTYSPVERDYGYYAALDNALRRAAARGVKVKMIVSDWSVGHPIIDHLKSLSLVPNIEVRISSIPDWSGGYIPFSRVEHCKFIAADTGKCWIGTSNAERSYFYKSRNVGVLIQNVAVTKLVRRVFTKSWEGPYTKPIRADVEYAPRAHGGE